MFVSTQYNALLGKLREVYWVTRLLFFFSFFFFF